MPRLPLVKSRLGTWAALSALLTCASVASAQSDAGREASEAAQQRAWKHAEAKRYVEAERGYREAIALWEDNDRALNNLAWMLLTAEDQAVRRPKEALALAQRAVALAPDEAGHLDTLATAHDALGQHLEAARLERRVIELDGKQPAFGEQLRAFARRGLAAEVERAPAERAELLVLAVRGELRAGAKGPALGPLLGELDQAAALQAPDAQALTLRAQVLAGLGHHEELLVAAEAALAAGAAPPALRRLRAEALERLGRVVEAAGALEEAVDDTPRDYELRWTAATLWKRAGRAGDVARVVSAAVVHLDREHPLWEGKWASKLHLLAAGAYEEGIASVQSDVATRTHALRRAALASRVHALAARAGSHAPEDAVRASLRELGHPAAALPAPKLRRALASEFLGQTRLPRFEDGSEGLAVRSGGRVAFADVDGDGDPDLLLGGATLLLNDGSGRFTRAPDCGLTGGARGGVFADFDRDGDLDLFVAGGGPDRLYRNESGPNGVRFRDVTAEVNKDLDDGHPSEGAAWGDFNGDGYPDLYVANYQLNAKQIDTGTPDRLWLSDGKGGLVGAHETIQQSPLLCGRGVSPCDVDLDGDVDLFVSNYRLDRDLLFVNEQGTLRERGRERGVAGVLQRGAYGHTIGAAWGDLDGDGDLDLVCANLAHPRFIGFSDKSFVYLQEPDGRFRDVREEVGIWFEETHSHPTLWDFDDDGDLDLSITSIYGGRPSYTYRNRLVEDGRLRFEDVSWATSTRVFNGWGSAAADVDLDGDLDFVVSAGGAVRLWLNQGDGAGNRSVRVRLRGTRSDTWGAYATATLTVGERRLVRQLALGEGTTCQSEPILHFGVGRAEGPFSLEVRWPAGGVSVHHVTPDRHEIREPEPRAPQGD